MENESTKLVEQVKKSQLLADGLYDLLKLQAAGEHFLSMEWEEEEETVTYTYDIARMTSFTEVPKEEFPVIINLLLRAAMFEKDRKSYSFSMEPANLYYNTNGTICIKSRDLNQPCSTEKEEFLLCYKALAACALTGQYSYLDYLEGGEELYEKNQVTAPFSEIQDTESMVNYLEQVKNNYLEKREKMMISVSKMGNRFLKAAVAVLFLSTSVLGVYGGIQYFSTIPYMTAVNKADNAYIENDTIALIGALRDIEVEELDKHQKYILARAYLQSENLTNEQKGNILEKLTLSSNEKELEYWINLGRLNVERAEDLAMQLSDDELLLYAYMKEKAQIESDTEVTGADKTQKLEEVQSKINSLADKYELLDDDDSVSSEIKNENSPIPTMTEAQQMTETKTQED